MADIQRLRRYRPSNTVQEEKSTPQDDATQDDVKKEASAKRGKKRQKSLTQTKADVKKTKLKAAPRAASAHDGSKPKTEWALIDTIANEVKGKISELGKSYTFGRNYRESMVNLGILSSKVSRKQIRGVLTEDGIACTNIGINTVRLVKVGGKPEGMRLKQGESFVWKDGDIVEFCIQTRNEASIMLKKLTTTETAAEEKTEHPATRKERLSTDDKEAQKADTHVPLNKASQNDNKPLEAPELRIQASDDRDHVSPRSPPTSPKHRLWNHQPTSASYRRFPSTGSTSPRLLLDSGKSPRVLEAGNEITHISGAFHSNSQHSRGAITSETCPFPGGSKSADDKVSKEEDVVEAELPDKDEMEEAFEPADTPSPTLDKDAVSSLSKPTAKTGKFPFRKKKKDDQDIGLLPSEHAPRIGSEFQVVLPMLMAKPKALNKSKVSVKGSVQAWLDAQDIDPLPEEEAGKISDDEGEDWTEEDRELFDKGMRDYPKDFRAMSKNLLASGKRGELPLEERTKKVIHYYYRNYKATEKYKRWKQTMTHETRSASAAFDGESGMGLRERRSTRSSAQSDKDERDSNSSRPSSRTQNAATVLKDLVDSGLIKPGKGVLSLSYHGKKFYSDLDSEGHIRYKNVTFESVSSWSVMIKRTINPKLRGDNGWTSVHYRGKSLGFHRDRYESVHPRNGTKKKGGSSKFYTEHQECIDGLLKHKKIFRSSRALRLNMKKTNSSKIYHATLCDAGPLIMDAASKQRFNTVVEWLIYRGFFTAEKALSASQQKLVWNAVSIRAKRSGFKTLQEWKAVWRSCLQKDATQESQPSSFPSGSATSDMIFCKCRRKETENTAEAWYIQCSKATSVCNGWIHPTCFNLEMTRDQGDQLSEFICPLCSADGLEDVNSEFHDSQPKPPEKQKRKLKRSRSNLGVQAPLSPSKKQRNTAPTIYKPGTLIRSIAEWPKGRPIGWLLGRIVEVDLEYHPKTPYRIAYGFETGMQEWCSLRPNEPTRMLADDWNKSKCYKTQDIRWRSLAYTNALASGKSKSKKSPGRT